MKNIIYFLFLIAFLGLSDAQAAPKKYEKETEVSASPNSKFIISAGWSFDEAMNKLVSPEGDLTAYLIERKAEKNLDQLMLQEWKKIDPKFSYSIQQKVSPPPKDGWEEVRQVTYEIPVKENRTVLSVVHVFKGTAYILLLDSSNAGLSKRAAQLQIVGDTWHPPEIQKEDLSGNKIKIFSNEDIVAMDKFIAHAMKELKIPGASVAIVQNGKEVYRKGFGVKKAGGNDKVTPETLFMIGSTTKPLTTLMLSKLVEQGKVRWDTPIQDVLPSFQLEDKKVTGQFQIKHTACACTGMPRRDMEFVFGSLSKSAEDTMSQLHTMKPTTGFGETFQYSNHLVAVGGFAGASVYGKGPDLFSKYETAMNDLVFAPLEMKSTRVKPGNEDLKNLASPHSRDLDSKMVPFPQVLDDMVYPIAPAGSIWSNVDDLSKYVLMELRLGKTADGKQLFSKEQIILRRTPGVKIDETTTYGLGLFLEKNKGISIIGHGGNTMGFTHDLFFLPDHDVGVVVQANAGSVNGFRNSIKQKILEILLEAKPKSEEMLQFSKGVYKQMGEKARERISRKSGDSKWIKDYVGTYTNKDLGRVTITSKKSDFIFETSRWSSGIATAKEKTGERLLALISPPWSGGAELRVSKESGKKLILDDEQSKYEFDEIK